MAYVSTRGSMYGGGKNFGGVKMAPPNILSGQQQHATNMSQAAAAGQSGLDRQNNSFQFDLLRNMFGGSGPSSGNPYGTIDFQGGMNRLAGGGGGGGRNGGIQGGSPVYSGQQQQQLINSGTALNDQQLATDLQGLRGSVTGQGFGANSPLMAALTSSRQSLNNAANADVRRQVPLEIAQANADNQLNTSLGAEQIRSSQFGDKTGLLSLLLGLI